MLVRRWSKPFHRASVAACQFRCSILCGVSVVEHGETLHFSILDMEERVSSGLPPMAVEPVYALSNEEWSVKELNSFLRNDGAYLSGKRRRCWSGTFSAFSGYFG